MGWGWARDADDKDLLWKAFETRSDLTVAARFAPVQWRQTLRVPEVMLRQPHV